MSPTDRAQEALLLKERWSLINQSGYSKSEIKIRGSRIFINKKPHGQVIDLKFQPYPLLGDVAPNLRALSNSSDTCTVTTRTGSPVSSSNTVPVCNDQATDHTQSSPPHPRPAPNVFPTSSDSTPVHNTSAADAANSSPPSVPDQSSTQVSPPRD